MKKYIPLFEESDEIVLVVGGTKYKISEQEAIQKVKKVEPKGAHYWANFVKKGKVIDRIEFDEDQPIAGGELEKNLSVNWDIETLAYIAYVLTNEKEYKTVDELIYTLFGDPFISIQKGTINKGVFKLHPEISDDAFGKAISALGASQYPNEESYTYKVNPKKLDLFLKIDYE